MNDFVKALVAGVAATATLVAVRNVLWAIEPEDVRRRERALRTGTQATSLEIPVRQAAQAIGARLDPATRARAATALAWGLGILGILAYAWARRRFPRAANGPAFGLLVWLVEDEGIIPALGWAKPPGAYPWQAHARGFAAHLAYGMAAEQTLRTLDRA